MRSLSQPIQPALLSVRARSLAAALAVAAGIIHFDVAPEHFGEAFVFGLFMTVAGAAQVAAGLLLLLRPTRPIIALTVLGTAAVLAVFAVAYTVGLPFGPDAGEPETLGTAVVLSKLAEVALLLVLARPFVGGQDTVR